MRERQRDREREREREGETEGERHTHHEWEEGQRIRGGERIPSRLFAFSAELDVGLCPTNSEIMSQMTLNQPNHPWSLIKYIFNIYFMEKAHLLNSGVFMYYEYADRSIICV